MRGFYTFGFEVLDESGIEGNTLLYLALRSLYNSHFPSQCTIACEMGNFQAFFLKCRERTTCPNPLRQDTPPPLDLGFWSFLTFLHRGIEEVERHLL